MELDGVKLSTTKGKRYKRKVGVDESKLYYKSDYSGVIDISDIRIYNQLKKMATYWLHKFSLDYEYVNDVILYIVEKSALYNAEKLNGGNSFSYYNVIARNYCLYLKKIDNMFVDLNNNDEQKSLDKIDYVEDTTIGGKCDSDIDDLYQCYLDFIKTFIDDFIAEFSEKFMVDKDISRNIFYFCARLLEERVNVIGNKHFMYLFYEEKFDRKIVKKLLSFLKDKYIYFKKYLYNF